MDKKQRIVLTRLLAGYILLFFTIRFAEFITPSRLLGPPLFNLGLDITYWSYWLLQLPSLLIYNRAGAILFDLATFLSGILVILFPLKRKWAVAFTILVILQCISFNTFALIHTVTVDGLIVVFLPFWITDKEKFSLAWQGIRYFNCYFYVAAFIWKSCIGDSLWYWQQGVGTFKPNLVQYLYHNPDTLLSGIFRWFLRNEWALNTGHIFVMLLEGTMAIGLFTKKYDRILLWLPIVIVASTYFFADVFIFELLVLNFAFIKPDQWERIGNKFPLLTYPIRHAQKNN